MTLRRPSWPRPCLCQFSPLSAARQDPPVRWIGFGAVERRHFASVVSNRPGKTKEKIPWPPVAPPTEPPKVELLLDSLLSAIRRKDAAATSTAFYAWTEALGDELQPRRDALIKQFMNLPSPVLSDIIRSMDPVRHPELDVAHGMNISLGETQFTDVGKLMDSYGVRVHHRKVLQGMLKIMELREGQRFSLRPADFTVFLRCVAAAVDFQAAPIVFGSMEYHDLVRHRTNETWIEFLKARFMLDPTSYQFNRTRVAVDPRDLITHNDLVQGNHEIIERMDRVRFSTNAFLREPWNRRSDEPTEDRRRQLRRSANPTLPASASDYRGFWRHFIRQKTYPQDVTEELMCTSMVGFSRSSDRFSILDLILRDYYGIEVDEETHTVTGGKDFPEDSPLYPTDQLLFALVETFGAMSEISLGMQLVDFVSQRYDIPISKAVWSNLLNWTYVCASKRYQHLRKIRGEGEQTHIDTRDVDHVWGIMTSEPYNIQPSFQDLDVHIKTLIILRRIDEALDLIRTTAMPYHDTLCEEFEDALMDEILIKDATVDPAQMTSTTVSRATHRRHQRETLKDHVTNRIAIWFDDILRNSSQTKNLREGSFTSTTIPDLVDEFRPFFQTGVRYRTRTGTIILHQPDDTARHRWVLDSFEMREVLPIKYGSVAVQGGSVDEAGERRKNFDEETGLRMENPDFEWPTTDPMRIIQRRRQPRRRLDELVKPPPFGDEHKRWRRKWWKALEQQLML